jgi:FixJ family two-component response regulator
MNEIEPIVFVVDDDALFLRSTERLIRSAGLNVQPFSSGREFLRIPRPEGPACVVLDVRMPGLSGIDLQRELIRLDLDIPIIFLTGHGDVPTSVRAMKAGAVEFLTKPFRGRELLDAINVAIDRSRLALQKQSEIQELRERYQRLTPREREVMALVVDGLLNKQIAGNLSTTEATVKFHRAHIMDKMRAETLVDLVRFAGKLDAAKSR